MGGIDIDLELVTQDPWRILQHPTSPLFSFFSLANNQMEAWDGCGSSNDAGGGGV